jgi:hypothetical protein
MIIRDALRCETCGKLHVVRIGMGQEESQQHRFPCRNCGEDIAVTLMVDYENTRSWVVFDENAVQDSQEAGAEIVNLDANFLIPSHLQGADLVSPRFEQIRDLARSIDESAPQPHRRPDYAAEWKLLRKAWNLHRSGQKPLSRVCVKTGSAAYYSHEPLTGLPDWLWRLTSALAGQRFDEAFVQATSFMEPLQQTPQFEALLDYYHETMAPSRRIKYFTLINAYFNAYSEFSQVQLAVTRELDLDETYEAASSDFDRTRMFYGNAFETLADMVDLLAFANNVAQGRNFGEFVQLTLKRYYELDKPGRFNPFAATSALAALCPEADNQLRNASHHNNMALNAATQVITYHVGKGGQGEERSLSYTEYLKRCVVIFLQAVNVLRLELILGQRGQGHSLFN